MFQYIELYINSRFSHNSALFFSNLWWFIYMIPLFFLYDRFVPTATAAVKEKRYQNAIKVPPHYYNFICYVCYKLRIKYNFLKSHTHKNKYCTLSWNRKTFLTHEWSQGMSSTLWRNFLLIVDKTKSLN